MSELKPLYIVGAGGFGREVAWLSENINKSEPVWDIKGFIDDDPALWGKVSDGYMIHGGIDHLSEIDHDVWCVIAVGNSKTRRKISEKISGFSNVHFATLIAPDVKIGTNSVVGEGTMICSGSIITVDAKIGSHNIINLDCTIGHDAVLSDYVTLYPSVNISGCVTLGEATEIGTGANIIQGIRIGKEVIAGAGAVLIKDIDESGTYVGIPARRIK